MEEKWEHVFLFMSEGQYPPAFTKAQKLNLKRYSQKFTLKAECGIYITIFIYVLFFNEFNL